jgi:hypothetical protein
MTGQPLYSAKNIYAKKPQKNNEADYQEQDIESYQQMMQKTFYSDYDWRIHVTSAPCSQWQPVPPFVVNPQEKRIGVRSQHCNI